MTSVKIGDVLISDDNDNGFIGHFRRGKEYPITEIYRGSPCVVDDRGTTCVLNEKELPYYFTVRTRNESGGERP